MARSVLVDEQFDWGADDRVRPHTHWTDTVVYEVHVQAARPDGPEAVPAPLRGTYAGLGHDAFVEHLVALGVTTVELLPVHELVDEPFLVADGRSNYWGYNSIGFFAPAARYRAGEASGTQVAEFKSMVAALHRAGLEVVLDVVYNHTAEVRRRARRSASGGWTTPRTTGSTTRATTSTRRGAGTPSTPPHRVRSTSSSTRCATG